MSWPATYERNMRDHLLDPGDATEGDEMTATAC